MEKQQLLDHVERSPNAVAVHDKPAWLSIFAEDYCVEDPVGSKPHRGSEHADAISRFYDTFIAPNEIRFEVAQDIVNSMHVLRDLSVHTTMSPSLSIQVPMHLLYELKDDEGQLKIHRLAAHWELMPMMAQVFSRGFSCVPVLMALTVRMFRYQGLSGVLGFAKAVFSVGSHEKRQVEGLFAAINEKDKEKQKAFFSELESVCIGEKDFEKNVLLNLDFSNIKSSKVLAAGNAISGSFSARLDGKEIKGVALFEFNKKTKKILKLRFYC
jgi:hypothetical protein